MVDAKLCSLIKVMETGSFTKAAETLSLSQPAVSQHVRQLENEYGIRIFDHAHNKFQLTREGELLLRYAKRVLALHQNLEQALKSEREKIRRLTIGITHTAESSAIIEALAAYASRFSNLNLKILTNTTDNLYRMLKNFELDFAFVERRISDASLSYLMVDTDSLVLAVPPNHRLAGRTQVTIDELKEEKLILRLPNSNTRGMFAASLESLNLSIDDFNILMEIDSIATIKDLIRRDFGVSVLAKSACMDELRKGKLAVLNVENLSMIREIDIVYPRSFEHPDLLQGIVDTYKEMQVE